MSHLNNYLKQALKDPNGRPATTVASMIFTPDILTALDASHEREMANDINFALYKLNEDYFQEQRDVLVEINHSKKILVCCSRRAGKSYFCAGAIVKSALKNPGSRIIYIETFANITTKTITGKLIYPIADLFVVQWKSMLELYPKAKFGGWIF